MVGLLYRRSRTSSINTSGKKHGSNLESQDLSLTSISALFSFSFVAITSMLWSSIQSNEEVSSLYKVVGPGVTGHYVVIVQNTIITLE